MILMMPFEYFRWYLIFKAAFQGEIFYNNGIFNSRFPIDIALAGF